MAVSAAPFVAAAAAPQTPTRSDAPILGVIGALAVVIRLAWRIHQGSADFWANGYSFFYDLATNLASGHGLCLAGACAMRMPVYPSFLALASLAGRSYLWIVVPEALIGAGTALCAYLIGHQLFNRETGILGGALTALYPYYAVHDTALQDTGLFTFLTAMAVWLLLRARRSGSAMICALVGLALAAAVLTRQTLAPFAMAALVWLAARLGFRRALLAVLLFVAPLCTWLVRNEIVVGSPVLTSDSGKQLWVANNAQTFSHYPRESIDLSGDAAYDALTPAEQRELDALYGNEIGASNWFRQKALAYIRTHPLQTLRASARKIAAGFSWNFNPSRAPLVKAVYVASYGPVSILGVIGMFLTRRHWRAHSLIYLLFLTFVCVTAISWAHTSHRSYLDVYWIVFAAYTLNSVFDGRLRRGNA